MTPSREVQLAAVRADWVLPMGDDSGLDPAEGRDVIPDATVLYAGPRIVAVGPAAEVSVDHPDVPVTHLPGHALLPGFVNAHTHLAMTMFRGVADDVCLEDFLGTVVPLETRLLTAETVRAASLAAMVESHLCGVTTALDMYFFADAVVQAAHEVGFRVLTGPVMLDEPGPDSPATTMEQRVASGEEWLRRRPAGADWRGAVGPHSTYLASRNTLVAAGDMAAAADALLHIHAGETAAEVELVRTRSGHRPVQLLDELGLLGNRTVVAHGVHLDRSEIRALARSGASVVHCPASNLKLASGIAPVLALGEAGVNVALGTDGAASSNDLDMLGAVRLAALLHKTVAPTGPDATAVSAREALLMATRRGAAALGLAEDLGVLAAGAVADMVAIDLRGVHTQPVHDVHSSIVYAAGRGDVTDVWSRGTRVVADARHTLVDQDEVARSLGSLGETVAREVRHF